MTVPMDYETRRREIHAFLSRLDPARLAAAVGAHVLDQVGAATRDARALLGRVGEVEHELEPGRFADVVTGGRAVLDDVQSRVLAAMGDGRWLFCTHLRRTPVQPSVASLPLRRVDCQRCASTVRKPPPDEADRCDLCGTRGHTRFWPVRFTAGHWLVLGDMCRDCADAIYPDGAAR